jgi:hypothetical protein
MAVTRTQTTNKTATASVTSNGAKMPPEPAIVSKKLTLFGLLDMIPGLAITVVYGITAFWTGIFRGEKDAKTLFLHIAYAVLRKATARLTPLQLQ